MSEDFRAISDLINKIEPDALFNFVGSNPQFLCSISQDLMRDPVFTADGHTYDRGGIRTWLVHHDTSPNTKLRLKHKDLTPNIWLRGQILEALEKLPKIAQPKAAEIAPNPPKAAENAPVAPVSNQEDIPPLPLFPISISSMDSISASSSSHPPLPISFNDVPRELTVSGSSLPPPSALSPYLSSHSRASASSFIDPPLTWAEEQKLLQFRDAIKELKSYVFLTNISPAQEAKINSFLGQIKEKRRIFFHGKAGLDFDREPFYPNELLAEIRGACAHTTERSLEIYLEDLRASKPVDQRPHRPYELYELQFSKSKKDSEFVSRACSPYHDTQFNGFLGAESREEDIRAITAPLSQGGIEYHIERGRHLAYIHQEGNTIRKVTDVTVTLKYVNSVSLFIASRLPHIEAIIRDEEPVRSFKQSVDVFKKAPAPAIAPVSSSFSPSSSGSIVSFLRSSSSSASRHSSASVPESHRAYLPQEGNTIPKLTDGTGTLYNAMNAFSLLRASSSSSASASRASNIRASSNSSSEDEFEEALFYKRNGPRPGPGP